MSTNETPGKDNWSGPPSSILKESAENAQARKALAGQEITSRSGEIPARIAALRRERGFSSSGSAPLGDFTPSGSTPLADFNPSGSPTNFEDTLARAQEIRGINERRRVKREQKSEVSKDGTTLPPHLEVRLGGGTIDIEKLAENTDAGELEDTAKSDVEELPSNYSPETQGTKRMTADEMAGALAELGRFLRSKEADSDNKDSSPVSVPTEQIDHDEAVQRDFDRTTHAFEEKLASLRRALSENDFPTTIPTHLERSTIPVLNEIVPSRQTETYGAAYQTTYSLGLDNDLSRNDTDKTPESTEHIDLPLEDASPSNQPLQQESTVPAQLETKHASVKLHKRKVIRGNFWNRSLAKVQSTLSAITDTFSGKGETAINDTSQEKQKEGSPKKTNVLRNWISRRINNLTGENKNTRKDSKDSSFMESNQHNRAVSETSQLDSMVHQRPKENIKQVWGSIGEALRQQANNEDSTRASQEAERKRALEEIAQEENARQKELWLQRQEKIGKMITGEIAIDRELLLTRFEKIDTKTKSIKEGILEKIGSEGMKLLSIFDRGANFIKNNVSTKTRVLAGAGMLAAAGISLYAAPVFATGAAISVVGAGMRIVSASGTYLTARALFEKMYKKAASEGRAYNNFEKTLIGTGAIVGSAALGMAVGQIFEHFFPADKVVEALSQVHTPDVPVSIPDIPQTLSAIPSAPTPEISIPHSGVESIVTSLPLELTEHVVKPGENLWTIIQDTMKTADFNGFNALNGHTKHVKILSVIETIMKDPEAYGIKGGNINHIAEGAKLHLAKAFIQ